MDITKFAYTRMAPNLAYFLVRILPKNWAYWLADQLAAYAAARTNMELIQAVRSNQIVVQELAEGDPAIDKAVVDVLQTAGRCQVDLFRAIARGRSAVLANCKPDDLFTEGLRVGTASGKGLIVVGVHMSNFDMYLLSLHSRGTEIQVLSYANPKESYKIQNDIRSKFGLNITPISMTSLRKAYKRLRRGGVIGTGVDRPDTGGEILQFFGRDALLPVGHTRLAVKTGASILAGVVRGTGPGKYEVIGSPLFTPPQTGDKEADICNMAQGILDWYEQRIRERPEEWLMFFPVWPESQQPATLDPDTAD